MPACLRNLKKKNALSLRFGGPPDVKDDESKAPRSSGHGSRAGGVSRRATKRSANVAAAMNMALADGAKLQNVRSLPSSSSSSSRSSSSTVPSVPAPSLSTTHSRVAALRKPELASRQSAAFQCTRAPQI